MFVCAIWSLTQALFALEFAHRRTQRLAVQELPCIWGRIAAESHLLRGQFGGFAQASLVYMGTEWGFQQITIGAPNFLAPISLRRTVPNYDIVPDRPPTLASAALLRRTLCVEDGQGGARYCLDWQCQAVMLP